jgi:NAD(P)-dependent dehydrogenase (short-subunit alcohol dehydrogenase family)
MNPNAASMDGKICLVTGATSGIGLETALALASRGGHVVMAGRSADRAEAARADVVARSGNERVETLLADLSTLGGVATLASEFCKRHDALHVLVNNAGVVNLHREVNADGFELTFAVNHLAYFALTHQLLDLLRASAPARIVSVSSEGHRFGAVDFDDLQSERAYRGLPLVAAMRVYGTSKLENLLFTAELSRRLEGSGVTANAVHPGAVATRLGQNNGAIGRISTRLLSPFFRTPAQGAATSIHVATAPELESVSGRYFMNERLANPSRASQDAAIARRLWDVSLELSGLED